jgi:hypothetical protein
MDEKPRDNAPGTATSTAQATSTEAFAVSRLSGGRFNVMSPWGRMVASFTQDEDGDLAPGFAEHEARLATAALHLVADRLQVPVRSLVLACHAAFDALEPWPPATGAGRSTDLAMAPVGGQAQ